jgi:hypothetical protein
MAKICISFSSFGYWEKRSKLLVQALRTFLISHSICSWQAFPA